MINKDKFGFYQVHDRTFYSRLEAVEYSKRTNYPVHWNFNEEVFSNYNWTVEPAQSLENLYAQRAQQIREKYDYIVLWYSGGADSHNVLSSFINNNIHVDEIAQFINYEASKDWDSYLNEEVAKVAVPETKKIQQQFPHIKHRLVDLSPIIKNLYDIDNNALDFVYKANKVFSPNQLSRTYLREKIKDYADIIDSGKSLCFVWGSEKPSIMKVDEKYCVYFADLIDNAVGVRTQQLNRPWEHDELFYWTPDAPDIVCKQAHILKKFCRSVTAENFNTYLTDGLIQERPSPMMGRRRGDIIVKDKNYIIDTHTMHRLIYPWWDTNTFSNGKNPSGIFSHRDLWWFLDKNSEDQQRFRYGILKLQKQLGGLVYTPDPQNPGQKNPMHINVRPMLSKFYVLE